MRPARARHPRARCCLRSGTPRPGSPILRPGPHCPPHPAASDAAGPDSEPRSPRAGIDPHRAGSGSAAANRSAAGSPVPERRAGPAGRRARRLRRSLGRMAPLRDAPPVLGRAGSAKCRASGPGLFERSKRLAPERMSPWQPTMPDDAVERVPKRDAGEPHGRPALQPNERLRSVLDQRPAERRASWDPTPARRADRQCRSR